MGLQKGLIVRRHLLVGVAGVRAVLDHEALLLCNGIPDQWNEKKGWGKRWERTRRKTKINLSSFSSNFEKSFFFSRQSNFQQINDFLETKINDHRGRGENNYKNHRYDAFSYDYRYLLSLRMSSVDFPLNMGPKMTWISPWERWGWWLCVSILPGFLVSRQELKIRIGKGKRNRKTSLGWKRRRERKEK